MMHKFIWHILCSLKLDKAPQSVLASSFQDRVVEHNKLRQDNLLTTVKRNSQNKEDSLDSIGIIKIWN